MIDSGLGRLQIGIESGNEKILNCYNKSLSLDDIRETVQVCFEEGLLSLVGNFIIGGPFETLETLDKSLAFAKELLELAPGCIDISSSIYTPYPSTKMFLEPEKFGVEILDSELITGSGLDYVFSRTSALTKWDLLKARANFNQEVEVKAVSLLPSIAEERIIRHFNAYLSFGLTAMWVKLLFKNRRGSNYFGLQASNGMKEFKEIIKEIDEYKPLRTVSIRNAEDDKILLKTDDGNQLNYHN